MFYLNAHEREVPVANIQSHHWMVYGLKNNEEKIVKTFYKNHDKIHKLMSKYRKYPWYKDNDVWGSLKPKEFLQQIACQWIYHSKLLSYLWLLYSNGMAYIFWMYTFIWMDMTLIQNTHYGCMQKRWKWNIKHRIDPIASFVWLI